MFTKMGKTSRFVFRMATVLLTLFVLISLAGAFYMVDFALCPKVRSADSTLVQMRKDYPQIEPWLDSLTNRRALRDTFVTAPDGARLHAYYVYASKPTSHTAVLVHGYTDNAIRLFHIGYLYNHDMDFNILIPDLRFAGQSEGTHIQMGWKDRLDVMDWMKLANNVFGGGKGTEMVVHGISMGGATTMMVSGEPQQ